MYHINEGLGYEELPRELLAAVATRTAIATAGARLAPALAAALSALAALATTDALFAERRAALDRSARFATGAGDGHHGAERHEIQAKAFPRGPREPRMPRKQQRHRDHKNKRSQRSLPGARPINRLLPSLAESWPGVVGTGLEHTQPRPQGSVKIGAQPQPELQRRA